MVVDVLSFTTAVSVAVDRGSEVIPCADEAAAHRLAAEQPGTDAAVKRSAVSPDHPWSLSPADLIRAPVARRLVLPSPNGSAIAATLASLGRVTVACSIRNVTAVADWLARTASAEQQAADPAAAPAEVPPVSPRRRAPVVAVAAGERWPDGSLRPALEDAIGAGLLLHLLSARSPRLLLSPAATLAARSVAGLTGAELASLVRESVSGRELANGGHAKDVEMAVQLDADPVVPVLSPGAAGRSPGGFRQADLP